MTPKKQADPIRSRKPTVCAILSEEASSPKTHQRPYAKRKSTKEGKRVSEYYTATGQAVAMGSTSTKAEGGQLVHTQSPVPKFPWGTVLLIGGVVAAGGAAAWEIEAHRQDRAVGG